MASVHYVALIVAALALLAGNAGVSTGYCYYSKYDEQEDRAYNYCHTTLTFYWQSKPIGSLTFSGPFNDWENAVFENGIAGGAGWFAGARGVVKVEVKEALQRYKYVIKLDEKSRECK
ncbi:hypothetical protein GPECTOR_526g517 [Gonium pectorale]|uniref:CBM20 domain-containing protein n=1 Tax=Gonium pectorale TaxID=33097 RepID=A0A150FUQ0_GONPE|nr:hypothetical protein GPECTOR_526g517 [Gonium pectorale]|eukprot:KXZ41354.1 hypothetical protein GPECTOR_526g517 [Gonium pectorale]